MSNENSSIEKVKGHPGFLAFWGARNKNVETQKVTEKVDTSHLKDENKE